MEGMNTSLERVRVLAICLLLLGSSLVNAQIPYKELERLSVIWNPIAEAERYSDHKRQEKALQNYRWHSRKVDTLKLLPMSLSVKGWRVDGGFSALIFSAMLEDVIVKSSNYYEQEAGLATEDFTFYNQAGLICGDYEIVLWENSVKASQILPRRVAEYVGLQAEKQGYQYKEADAYNSANDFSSYILTTYDGFLEREGFGEAKEIAVKQVAFANLVPSSFARRLENINSPQVFRKVLEDQAALDLHRSIGFALKRKGRNIAGLVSSMPLSDKAPKLYGSYLVLCNMNRKF